MRNRAIYRAVEALEPRRVLSSAVLASGGQLKIEGDRRIDDVVTLGFNSRGDKVDVGLPGGVVRSFNKSAVKGIVFTGRSGDDTLIVSETNGTFTIPVTFYGGKGNDTFKGGGGNDLVYGEAGNDALSAGGGKNVLYGGSGSDAIAGASGDDSFYGDDGDDTITAGLKSVAATGGAGKDTFLASGATQPVLASIESVYTIALPKIYVIFNGTSAATIINPYSSQGVTISSANGAVTVTNTSGISGLEYHLLGTSAAGSLNVNSTTPSMFVLTNLSLTNAAGPAINVTGGQTSTFVLKAETTSSLTDGSGNTKNGTLQTDGKLIISGTGALAIKGTRKHGISTTSSIDVQSSALTITSAASDGLHSEGFALAGGTVTVAASGGDGVDAGDGAVIVSGGTLNVTSAAADVKALKTGNNSVVVSGGELNLNVSGNASKAISAKGAVAITSGTFGIQLAGAPILAASGSGFDPSYAAGIKSDTTINIGGGNFTITAAATAGGAKAISAGGNTTVTNGTFNVSTAGNAANYVNPSGVADSYSTSSFTTDASLNIGGGTFNVTNSGSGGKGLSADGNINITGGTIDITNSGAAGRGLNADGNVTIGGGGTTISLSGATQMNALGSGFDPSYPSGIKANGTIAVSSGSVTVVGTTSAAGARGLSGDVAINVSGGTVAINLAGGGTTYTNSTGVIDSYGAAAFSSDAAITVTAGTVTTTSSGVGGKGLKSDGTIVIGSSTTTPVLNLTTTGDRFLTAGTDYHHPKTMVAVGPISIFSGNITIASTDDGIHSDTSVSISGGTNRVSAISATKGVGEGVEAPIVNISGGVTNVTASNDAINATFGTVTGGTNDDDGSQVNISGGVLVADGSDGIDSNGDIVVTGGTTIVSGPSIVNELALDYNGEFYVNGGLLIGAGYNSTMTHGMTSGSTQVGVLLKSSTMLPSNSLLHIRGVDGTELVTFKPKNDAYYFHFSSGVLAQNTQYRVYFGGTYTGGGYVGGTSGWGLLGRGTYSLTGATRKVTFTTSTTSKVSVVSF